jgi:hypothetical protein
MPDDRPVISETIVWETETVPYVDHRVELYADSTHYEISYTVDSTAIKYEYIDIDIELRKSQ